MFPSHDTVSHRDILTALAIRSCCWNVFKVSSFLGRNKRSIEGTKPVNFQRWFATPPAKQCSSSYCTTPSIHSFETPLGGIGPWIKGKAARRHTFQRGALRVMVGEMHAFTPPRRFEPSKLVVTSFLPVDYTPTGCWSSWRQDHFHASMACDLLVVVYHSMTIDMSWSLMMLKVA